MLTTQEPTDGAFEGTYNVAGKTIIGSYNFSPNHKLRKSLDVVRPNILTAEEAQGLPRVRQWSEVIWIVWQSLAQDAGQARSLKYIFKHHVITYSTQFIIEQILGLGHLQMPEDGDLVWPGRKFLAWEDNFFALLGTAHGTYP